MKVDKSKTIHVLNLQAETDCTHTFIQNTYPSFVDDECKRLNYFSSRWANLFRPDVHYKNVAEFRQSINARVIHNLKKIGCNFEMDKPFSVMAGYGHIKVTADASISRGLPDCPNDRVLLFVLNCSAPENEDTESYTHKKAQLMMMMCGVKKSFICYANDRKGAVSGQVVELNLVKATQIMELCNEAAAMPKPPERLFPINDVTAGKAGTEKCQECPYVNYCMLPDSPYPSCRNCTHIALGANGYAACTAKNNQVLSVADQHNRERCPVHVYKPVFIDSWAKPMSVAFSEKNQDQAVGYNYVNLLTGEMFSNTCEGQDGYSSYEINGTEGKELVGDRSVDKIRKAFSAKIEDK